MSSEKIWYKDIKHFITPENYDKFIPTKDMSFVEQMNALLRMGLYFSLIVFLIKHNTSIFFIPLVVAIFTFFFNEVRKTDKFLSNGDTSLMKNKRDGSVCTGPTKQNPFMNVLMTEYNNNPARPKACDLVDESVKSKAKTHFEYNLYRDVDDIYHKNASDRQFYTTPSSTIPNDANSFAKWCYEAGPTCKEGNGMQCYTNMYRHIKS